MALQNLEDRSAVAVHADELEERGDPRAELVRAQLSGDRERTRELIKAHWSEWIGSIAPSDVLLRWQGGYVAEAALSKRQPPQNIAELLTRSPHLRRLALGDFGGLSLSELGELRSLRELVLLRSWPRDSVLLMELRTLSLADASSALSTVMAPRLETLHTRCAARDEMQLLRTLSSARWWASLTKWTHRVQSTEGLAGLLRLRPLVDRGGRGLTALCELPLLKVVSPELKQALPHARFTLMPLPSRPRDPEDSHGPPTVSVMPTRTDFRELSGWVTESNRSTQSLTDSEKHGPGVPFGDDHKFHSCAWCASSDTRHISDTYWQRYSRFETTSHERWSYECMECGLFTFMNESQTH